MNFAHSFSSSGVACQRTGPRETETIMRRAAIALAGLLQVCAMAGEGAVVDSMDEATFKSDKCKVEVVDGKVGKALKFTYGDQCSAQWATRGNMQPTPEWDSAAGFSFWVKGDGSDHLGGIQ